eukprot:TRINITY_DN48859_c0_g1_i1.p1 TRINITY_DN48859_c0_g1~~TRINITY_DN48859_c0_g1_i1.p1  ORF type:complete len:1230 (+),score=179.72 TRINITY_DN48859_c0_g1_i1:247-3690(+)
MVAGQRSLCAWHFHVCASRLERGAALQIQKSEQDFDDNMNALLRTGQSRKQAMAFQFLKLRAAVDRMHQLKFYFLKWLVARQLLVVTDAEGRQQYDHEEQLGAMARYHKAQLQHYFEAIGQRWVKGVVACCKQKFFTAWSHVKPLKKKTALFQFLGAWKTKAIPNDELSLEARLEIEREGTLGVLSRQRHRNLLVHMLTTWVVEVRTSRLLRQATEASERHQTAFKAIQQARTKDVERLQLEHNESLDAFQMNSIKAAAFTIWSYEVELVKTRVRGRVMAKDLEKDFEREVVAMSKDEVQDRLKDMNDLSEMFFQREKHLLYFVCFRGWIFQKSKTASFAKDVAIAREVAETKAKLVQMEALADLRLERYVELGWRLHHKERLHWRAIFAWERAISIRPRRQTGEILSIKRTNRFRRLALLGNMVGKPSRHTAGIFSDGHNHLLALSLFGRWAFATLESVLAKRIQRERTIWDAQRTSEHNEIHTWMLTLISSFNSRIFARNSRQVQAFVFAAWLTFEAQEVQARFMDDRLQEKTITYQKQMRAAAEVAHAIALRWGTLRESFVRRRGFVAWRAVIVIIAAEAEVGKEINRTSQVQARLDEVLQRPDSEGVLFVVAKTVGGIARRRGDALFLCVIIRSWAGNVSTTRSREGAEALLQQTMEDNREELKRWRNREESQRSRARMLVLSMERLASKLIKSNNMCLTVRHLYAWCFLAAFAKENTRMLQLRKASEHASSDEIRLLTKQSKQKEATTAMNAARAIVVYHERYKLRSVLWAWRNRSRIEDRQKALESSDRRWKEELLAVQAAHSLEVKENRIQFEESRKNVVRWIGVAQCGVVRQRAFVWWLMQVRLERFAVEIDTARRDFQTRLQAEARTRAAVEAEAMRRRGPVQSKQPAEDAAVQTGLAGDEGTSWATRWNASQRVGPIPEPTAALALTRGNESAAERMANALADVCRRRVAMALLSMLTHESQSYRSSPRFSPTFFADGGSATAGGRDRTGAPFSTPPVSPLPILGLPDQSGEVEGPGGLSSPPRQLWDHLGDQAVRSPISTSARPLLPQLLFEETNRPRRTSKMPLPTSPPVAGAPSFGRLASSQPNEDAVFLERLAAASSGLSPQTGVSPQGPLAAVTELQAQLESLELVIETLDD